MSDSERINIRRVSDEWRVWLPHSCAPTELIGDEHDQEAWGDFYFRTYADAAAFVSTVTRPPTEQEDQKGGKYGTQPAE